MYIHICVYTYTYKCSLMLSNGSIAANVDLLAKINHLRHILHALTSKRKQVFFLPQKFAVPAKLLRKSFVISVWIFYLLPDFKT